MGNVKLRNAGYRLVAPHTPNAQAARPATPPMVPPLTVSLSLDVSAALLWSNDCCGRYRYSCDVLVMLLLFFWGEDLHLVEGLARYAKIGEWYGRYQGKWYQMSRWQCEVNLPQRSNRTTILNECSSLGAFAGMERTSPLELWSLLFSSRHGHEIRRAKPTFNAPAALPVAKTAANARGWPSPDARLHFGYDTFPRNVRSPDASRSQRPRRESQVVRDW